jgi:16S rRNA processing protein RimM
VESASGEYGHFAQMTEVTVRRKSAGGVDSPDSDRIYPVEKVEFGGTDESPVLYMKLAGIDSPEEAKRVSGCALAVPRKNACPLKEGEQYVDDLKQCALVFAQQGQEKPVTIGSITGVLESGAGSLFEVRLDGECESLGIAARSSKSGLPRTALIPYNREFIGAVDVDAGKVELLQLWILE